MKAHKIIFTVLLGLLTLLGVTSCEDDAYHKIDDLFQPRLISEPVVESNQIAVVWYKVNEATSYTIEAHLDNYYTSLFSTYETTEPLKVLNDLPYGTRFYIRIRCNAEDGKNNSTWTYTNALTEPRPEFAKLLQAVSKGDISENSAIIHWTVDSENPVDSISLAPYTPEYPVIGRYLTDEEIAQGFAEVVGLEKSSLYNVNIYDTSKPGKYDKPYNQVTFRTAGPSAESIIVDRDDDLSAMLLANNTNADIPDGTEYFLPAGSYYKVVPFAMKKGFKIVGSTGGILPQIELGGSWNVEDGSYISTFEFENIDFYQTIASSYFFNSGNSWTMENVSFFNCSFTSFQRGFWRHQGANKLKHIMSLAMEECRIDKCGAGNAYGTFSINSSGSDNIERVVFTNCTFMRDNTGGMPNIFDHKVSEYPIHLEFRNVTIYNYAANKQLINIDNTRGSTFIFENVLIASPSGKIYSAPAGTVTSFANNYVTTDYLLGPSLVNGTQLDVNAAALFTDPANGDLTIKDANSPIVINRVGDKRWLP